MKPKVFSKKTIVKIMGIIIFILAVGYVIKDVTDNYLMKERGKYYDIGVLAWNQEVINNILRKGIIPSIINNTRQESSILKICEDLKNG